MKILGVIPSRYKSTRFPGKPLRDLAGKTMLQHVYEGAKNSKIIQKVIVATDSDKIYKTVREFNGEVVMTSSECKSGTDRVAEAIKEYDCDIVVNIQGDEPLIKGELIDEAIKPMLDNCKISVSTCGTKIYSLQEIHDPNIVKVVCDKEGFALYFSRSGIPYFLDCKVDFVYKHIGLYVYRKSFLVEFSKMDKTRLEIVEKLEQLRILENGYKIKVVITPYNSIGVDVPEDLNKVKKLLEKNE